MTSQSVQTFTVTGRLWRTPGVGLYVALVLVAPVLLFQATRVAGKVLGGSDLGVLVTTQLTIDFVDERWPIASRGDRLVMINGDPVRSSDDVLAAQIAMEPGPVTLTFERGGRRLRAEARATTWPPGYTASVWIRIACAAAMFILGLAVFLMRPGTKATWLFLAFCYVCSSLILLGWLRLPAWLFFTLRYALTSLTAATALHLFTVFPRPVPLLNSRRREALLYVPALLLPVVYLAPRETALWRVAEVSVWIFGAISAVLALTVLVLQYRAARRSEDHQALPQYRALLVGAAGGQLAPALAFTLPQILDMEGERWLAELSFPSVVFFCAIAAYTLFRHNPLQIDRFTAAVVGYGSTLAVLGFLYGGVLIGVPLLVGRAGPIESPAALIIVTAAASASFRPLYRQLKRRIDHWFFRDAADAERAMEILQALVAEVQGASGGDQALRAAVRALETLQADRCEIWTLREDRSALARALGGADGDDASDELPQGSALAAALARGAAGGLHGLSPRELDASAQEELWARGLAFAAPVRTHGHLVGFVGLGRKRSGTSYRSDELAFVAAVAAQIALVLERIAARGGEIGRYRIEERIGVGGAAEVFAAWQLGPGGFERKVALKRPLPELADDPDAAAMFLDEARIASCLHHSNIAQIYEIDHQDGAYFIAMEYISGPSLRALLRDSVSSQTPVPLPVAITIAEAILAALDHAHSKLDPQGRPLHLVHRDVTPNNVLLSQLGEIKLVDFGLASATSKLYRTRTGMIRGTLPYMAPEQAQGRPLDGRADIYGAGAVIYELLTLERPFPGGPTPEPPPPPATRAPGIPAAFDPVVLTALAYEPGDRYATASQFLDALVHALSPRPPATPEEVAAWLRTLRRAAPRSGDEVATIRDKPRFRD